MNQWRNTGRVIGKGYGGRLVFVTVAVGACLLGGCTPDRVKGTPPTGNAAVTKSAKTTLERVRAIIIAQLEVKESDVVAGASFTGLGADSLDVVELVMALEEEFDISIPDEEAEKLKTVGDAVKYIDSKTSEKQ